MEKCRRMKRQRCMSKNRIYSWLWRSSKTRQQYCRSESFAMKTGIPTNGSMVKKHTLLKTGFGYTATWRTSFLMWFQACQVHLLDRHRLQWHLQSRRVIVLTSSSSSSSSPTATSSDNETREREDRTESDTSPDLVSTNVDDRTVRPVKFWNPGVAARIQGKFGGWWSSWTRRLTRQFFSWSKYL